MGAGTTAVAAERAFRNCQVAAPLKQRTGRGPRRRSGAFRNCQVAAPLKLGVGANEGWFSNFLPQLSSCGPIEAAPH